MKVKLTYPVPGHQTQAGHIIDIDPQKAKVWIKNEWCIEVDDEPIKQKVKHEPKPAKKH